MLLGEFLNYLVSLFNFSVFCAAQPMRFIGCGKFWGVCFILAEALLFLFCIYLVHKILRERAEWREYLKRKEQREKIADAETMAKYTWNGDY